MEKYYLRIITLETCCREKEKMYKKGTKKKYIYFVHNLKSIILS